MAEKMSNFDISAKMSIFDILSKIDVNDKTEKKGNLTYLSWAWAWAEIKKAFPDANYTIYERDTQYGPVNYFTDGKTCWVKTGLTINGLEHIEELYVMDFRNDSIPLEKVTSKDVNKSIQRSLTKAAARHGLGLYIYAGEDMPEDASEGRKREKEEFEQKKQDIEAAKLAELEKETKKAKKDAPAKVEPVDELPW